MKAIRMCSRCGAAPAADIVARAVPFSRWYCAPCLRVRAAERARADIVQGPIVEKRA